LTPTTKNQRPKRDLESARRSVGLATGRNSRKTPFGMGTPSQAWAGEDRGHKRRLKRIKVQDIKWGEKKERGKCATGTSLRERREHLGQGGAPARKWELSARYGGMQASISTKNPSEEARTWRLGKRGGNACVQVGGGCLVVLKTGAS